MRLLLHLSFEVRYRDPDRMLDLAKPAQEEAHLLALDLWRTFQQGGIHAEAERALRFLEVACRGRVATPVLAERVGRFLDQAQRDRTLRFEPAALVGG